MDDIVPVKSSKINLSQLDLSQVDLSQVQHANALAVLMDRYASDPMGGGQPLSEFTQKNLVKALQQRDDYIAVLAFVDGQAAGLINCFEGFSTFQCRPLLNIHDVIVDEKYRGMGLSTRMLEKVEQLARDSGCCKLTLEVLEGNQIAKASYTKAGFSGYQLDPQMGHALFWEKKL